MNKTKKILYITRYSIHQEFNLKSKFDGQLNAFKNLGFDTYFIGFDEKNFYLINGDEKTIIGKTHFGFPSYLHTLFYNDLHKAAIKAINSIDFDYVYWRAAPIWGSSCKLAKVIKDHGIDFIYEIPTFPPQKEEHLNWFRKLFDIYSSLLSKKFHDLINYYVVIGEDAGCQYKGKIAINIENGIDINNIPVRTPKNDGETVHILALASMCYWHGYDRLLKSLSQYKNKENVIIHMVGGNDGGCLEEWKKLASKLSLSEHVIFHGQLSGKALQEVFDLCDIGINSLGLYRKNFAVTMELKAREYIARGLPFVYTVEDPGFANIKESIWLRIPNDDSIPNMEDIIDFAIRVRQDLTHTGRLRNIACENFTWERQYKKVFEIIGEKIV